MKPAHDELSKAKITQRVLALTLALIVVVPLSALAAHWQWNRHIERETRNALIMKNASQAAIPFDQLIATSQSFSQDLEFRNVIVTGVFQTSKQKLWRKQPLEGQSGFVVLTPLDLTDGREILVARGWVAAVGRDPSPTVNVAPPSGQVSMQVRLRVLRDGDSVDPSDLPANQTNSPQTMVTSKTVNLMAEIVKPPEPTALTLIPLEPLDSGPHLGYVGQWFIIGLTAFAVYAVSLKRLRDTVVENRTMN